MARGKIKNPTEQYCLDKLKEAGLFEGYENETFTVLDEFWLDNDCYARTQNGKGDFINRGDAKIRAITYTPDFVGEDYIIEVKGYIKAGSYDAFPLRFKLFKAWLKKNEIGKMLFVPRNKKEIDMTIQLILESRKRNQE